MPQQGPATRLENLHQRARIVQTIRAFFVAQGFLEVETPHRIPANAPEKHILPYSSDGWQLQTSPELAMKRLLAAGATELFQICRCWRQEERGNRHLTEFTLLEWYRAQSDYRQLMADCETLFRSLCPSGQLTYQGTTINLTLPFERLTVAEAFSRYADTTTDRALANGRFDEIYAFEIEPRLGRDRPTFLVDFPLPLAALARRKKGEPVAERFELIVAGMELANAFSELTDTAEQRHRFEQEIFEIRKEGRGASMPEPFLKELDRMPPAAGIALGVDRLVMLLLNVDKIDRVVAFSPEEL